MKKKNLAFTLAEVLIVIAIIGVVAALTLPNLNHATGDKERITKVKKIYSTLNEAFDRAQVVYGSAEGWIPYIINQVGGDSEASRVPALNLFTDRMSEFMKVSKITTSDGTHAEEGVKIITLPGDVEFYVSSLDMPNPGPSGYFPSRIYLGYIAVDLDGFKKGKNQPGYDYFEFTIYDQGIYPNEGSNDINYIFSDYAGHSKWIIENDNADYLKADEEGKCPNGVQLNWTQTSCN